MNNLPLTAQSALGIYGAPPLMIIETTCNHLYSVRETGNPNLAHVWMGVEVKRTKAGFVPKARAREELVRKEGSRVIMEPVADPFSRIA